MASIIKVEPSDSATESEYYSEADDEEQDEEAMEKPAAAAAAHVPLRIAPTLVPSLIPVKTEDPPIKCEQASEHKPSLPAPSISSTCPGCYVQLKPQPTDGIVGLVDYCDCCERLVNDILIADVREEDGFTRCVACDITRKRSRGKYEESLDVRPEGDWIECLHLSCIHLERVIALPGTAEAAAAREKVDELCNRRKRLQVEEDAALMQELSVARARELYMENFTLQKQLLAVLTQYARMLFTAIVDHTNMIPHDFVEVAVAVFCGETRPKCMEMAVAKSICMKEKSEQRVVETMQVDLLPRMKSEPCTSCSATLKHVDESGRGNIRMMGYCHCCKRLAAFCIGSFGRRDDAKFQVCECCSIGDAGVLAVLELPFKYYDTTNDLIASIGPLARSVKGGLYGAVEDPQCKTLEETFESWKVKRKDMMVEHPKCHLVAKYMVQLSKDKYQERIQVERGTSAALVEYAIYLMKQAATRKLPNSKVLNKVATLLYATEPAPDDLKVYLAPVVPSAKGPANPKRKVPPPPCGCCGAVLANPEGATSVGFCDCCKRVLPATSVSSANGDVAVSVCVSCKVPQTPMTTERQFTKRFNQASLYNFIARLITIRKTLDASLQNLPAHRSTQLAARMLSTAQELENLKKRRKNLSTRQKTAVRNAQASVLGGLYAEEVAVCDEQLVLARDYLDILAEIGASIGLGKIKSTVKSARAKSDDFDKSPVSAAGQLIAPAHPSLHTLIQVAPKTQQPLPVPVREAKDRVGSAGVTHVEHIRQHTKRAPFTTPPPSTSAARVPVPVQDNQRPRPSHAVPSNYSTQHQNAFSIDQDTRYGSARHGSGYGSATFGGRRSRSSSRERSSRSMHQDAYDEQGYYDSRDCAWDRSSRDDRYLRDDNNWRSSDYPRNDGGNGYRASSTYDRYYEDDSHRAPKQPRYDQDDSPYRRC